MSTESLTRKTLSILSSLNKYTICSLDDLYRETGLPRSTIHRILNELIDLQFVVLHKDTHLYGITSQCERLACGVSDELKLVERISDRARSLTQQHGWPIAIATCENDQLVVRFSSRPGARFSYIKSTVGRRFPMIGSALGEVWIAHRYQREQRRLLQTLPADAIDKRLERLGLKPEKGSLKRVVQTERIDAYLKQVKEQGYAVRRGNKGESSNLSVPLFQGRQLMGSLAISVFTSVAGERIVDDYLDALQLVASSW